jgi:Immunity protein 42
MPIVYTSLPATIGDPSLFAIRVDLDEHYNGEWLFGRIGYVIGNQAVGNYELGTSLRDVLHSMHWKIADANQRKTLRFQGQPKEKVFNDLSSALYGDPVELSADWDEIIVDECWAKHDITIRMDVLNYTTVYQVDEDTESRIIWIINKENRDSPINEIRVPLGYTENVFLQLFRLLNQLLEREEQKHRQ